MHIFSSFWKLEEELILWRDFSIKQESPDKHKICNFLIYIVLALGVLGCVVWFWFCWDFWGFFWLIIFCFGCVF